jgi:(+)-trans-carveol dehydrogenase
VRMAEEGADVVAFDICGAMATVPVPPSTAEDLAETVRGVEALGRRIVAVAGDVRDGVALSGAVDAGMAEFGRLDIVVANAGTVSYGRATDLSEEEWQTVIDVNLTGVWRTCKATVPHIVAGGRGGSVIITSSVGGLRGYEHIGHYIASKHGLVGLMRTLALELAQHSIRVNTIHPANVATTMVLNKPNIQLFVPDVESPTSDDVREVTRQMHVLPVDLIEPWDIADAVVFLASDESRYITGSTFAIDAGSMLK